MAELAIMVRCAHFCVYVVVEGKATAVRFRCKYIEVSAVFSHKLDELLVGIIKQMRLKLLVKIFKKINTEKPDATLSSCLTRTVSTGREEV